MLIHAPLNPKRSSGFTILETLISIALLGVVLTLVFNYFMSANTATSTIVNQNALQSELRTAAEIIGDEVQRAYYVFPPCGTYPGDGTAITFAACNSFVTATATSIKKLNVTWGGFKIISSGTRFQTPSGGYEWTVGSASDPILAMISPPRNATIRCTATVTNDQSGCFSFTAYYPVKRSGVTGSAAGDATDYLNDDLSNDNGWVLMEYRQYLDENIVFDSTYTDLAITGLGTLKGSSSTTNHLGTLTIPGLPNVNVAAVNWLDVGCFAVDANNSDCATGSNGLKLKEPSYDPNPNLQNIEGSLPAITNATTEDTTISAFAARMQATVRRLELSTRKGTPKILVDYIEPTTGFALDFVRPGAVDQRGVPEVHLTLQGGIRRGSKLTKFPSAPIEVYATPRNITPQ
jgi:type II secretory pathway pseudopilin PulG